MYHKVIRCKNWCSIDQCGPYQLNHYDKVVVKWPNHTKSKEIVHIDKFITYESEMGIQRQIPHLHAYVIKKYKGVTIKVPLLNLYILRYKE
jgi:hypothetical protein